MIDLELKQNNTIKSIDKLPVKTKVEEIQSLREKTDLNNNFSKTLTNSQFLTTATSNEFKHFNITRKIKETGLLQHELKNEKIRRENTEMTNKQKDNEEMFNRELYSKYQKQERERLKKQEEAKNEDKKGHIDRHVFHLQKKKENELESYKKFQLFQQKQEQVKKKHEEYRQIIDKMYDFNRQNLQRKQYIQQQKDQKRREILDQTKYETNYVHTEKTQRNKNRIEKNLRKFDKIINENHKYFEDKYIRNDMKKQEFDNLRGIAFKEGRIGPLKPHDAILSYKVKGKKVIFNF